MFSEGRSGQMQFTTFLSFIIQELGLWIQGWRGWERERSQAECVHLCVCVSYYITVSRSVQSHWESGMRFRTSADLALPSFPPLCWALYLLSKHVCRLPFVYKVYFMVKIKITITMSEKAWMYNDSIQKGITEKETWEYSYWWTGARSYPEANVRGVCLWSQGCSGWLHRFLCFIFHKLILHVNFHRRNGAGWVMCQSFG